jgi:hypothetical protein
LTILAVLFGALVPLTLTAAMILGYVLSPYKFVDNNVFRKAIDVHTVFPCRRAVTTTIIQVFIAGISVQKERG